MSQNSDKYFFDLGPSSTAVANTETTTGIFDYDQECATSSVIVGGQTYNYVKWGSDNHLPYKIRDLIESNEVMSQNKLFNILTCFGRGIEYNDVHTQQPTVYKPIREFFFRNSLKRFFAEQITDLKYYYFCVCVIILDHQRKHIVRVVHKDACYCRFTRAVDGRVEYVLYGAWDKSTAPPTVEVIPLLSETDPLGDLMQRLGREPNSRGRMSAEPGRCCKYAVVSRVPTVGCRYYPVPYYAAVFRDGWYDIYNYLTQVKKAKIKNGTSIRYHVEINRDLWGVMAEKRGIGGDPDKVEEMKDAYIENLRDYLSGSENSDKLFWSEFESNFDGKENHYVRINVIDTTKQGGDYSDDIQEVANTLCYADNVHPNLAGAVPGKSQMNNSGSDKRELFTMKQSLETLFHDVLLTVHNMIIFFNGWAGRVYPDIPMILLTTLDQNTDAKQISTKQPATGAADVDDPDDNNNTSANVQ
jgi:hypothetical protein